MSDVLPQTSDHNEDTSTAPPTRPPRRPMRLVGLLLIGVSLLLGLYLLVGYMGWQSGQAQLAERQESEMAAQIARQVSLAQDNIDQGSYTLALRRLEWVLERSPNHAEAVNLRETAQTLLNITPTPITQATVTPTPEPVPSPTPGLISDPLTELQRLRLLAAKEQWDEAETAVLTFQRQFPDYERQETNQLLYDSYVGLGLNLIEGEQAELGLFYLNQAEELGDLPQEVQDYRLWAEWYLQGIGFYGVNWEIAVGYFRDLCLVAPFYQSSCELLRDSLISYADLYAFAQDWCPAVDFYVEAQRQGNSTELAQKLEAARTGCLEATPTPGVITGTVPITDVQPFGGTSSNFLPTPGTENR
ncbi:MAG: hypothetical protein R3E31_09615 [Chloroflexota bacterium]